VGVTAHRSFFFTQTKGEPILENKPTQWSPKQYDWFTQPTNVVPAYRQEVYNQGFHPLDEDPYERILREKRLSEIRAGIRIPTLNAGDFDTIVDDSTVYQKAAAGLERMMETASASGWGETTSQPQRELYRELTQGKYRDFAKAAEVESLQSGDMSDWWSSLLDAMPFTANSTEELNEMTTKLLQSQDDSFTPERKLEELKKLMDADPEIGELASAYGVDLVNLALSSRNKIQLRFAIQQKIKDGIQQKRYGIYETADLGWYRRLGWNAAEMVQDPYFARDLLVTTAATAGLGTVELAAARLGAAGIQAGTRVAQLTHQALKFTGPMVGFVEGPAFVALRAAAPRIGVVGARAAAIAVEGGTAGYLTNLKTQENDYAIKDLLYNDKQGLPFKADYSQAFDTAIMSAGLGVLALGTLRTALGALGDVPAMRRVKSAGGTFGDMLRAYGREWTSSLDNWATSPQGLTVWGNTLSGGRGIYFGDALDRMARRDIDGRNFTNVLAGGTRVWGAADPIVAARLNIDMEKATPIIERFESITGVAGEAAMRGVAGGEAADIFKALVDVENFSKKGLSADDVVGLLDEINLKLKDVPTAPTRVGQALDGISKLDKLDYGIMTRAVGRGLNALSISKQLETRGLNFSAIVKQAEDLKLRPVDIIDDADWDSVLVTAAYEHGRIDQAISSVILKQLFDFDPAKLSTYSLKVDEANGIKQGVLDAMAPQDEFTVVSGASAVRVNKKSGSVTPLKTTLEVVDDKFKIFVEQPDGSKIELRDLSGDDVVSSEKVALEINKLNEKVRALFSDEAVTRMAEEARKSSAAPETVDADIAQLKKAWDNGQHPNPKLLARLFGLTPQQAVVGYAVVRALGFGPMETTLRFASGTAGKAGFLDSSRAEIAFFTTEGANRALIRATKSSDLGSLVHEMGHFAINTVFGRGLYNADTLRKLGITETMERKFLEWAGVKFENADGTPKTPDEIEADINSVTVQERLANGWNAYMRSVLMNKATKGDSSVKRLFNKLGDFVGGVGEKLKSAETEEAKLTMTAEAEEVFGILLARSEANIDDIFSAAWEGVFKTQSPELRDQVGVHILGEARFNDWKAKQELLAAAEKSTIDPLVKSSTVRNISPEEAALKLDNALGRSVSRRRVREWLNSLNKNEGESDEAFKLRKRELVKTLASELARNSELERTAIDRGNLTFSGDRAAQNRVDVTPDRLKTVATKELMAFIDLASTDPAFAVAYRPLAIDDIGIRLNDDGSLGVVVRTRGFDITVDTALDELARRERLVTSKLEEQKLKELIKAEEETKKAEAKARKEAEKTLAAEKKTAEAEAKKASREEARAKKAEAAAEAKAKKAEAKKKAAEEKAAKTAEAAEKKKAEAEAKKAEAEKKKAEAEAKKAAAEAKKAAEDKSKADARTNSVNEQVQGAGQVVRRKAIQKAETDAKAALEKEVEQQSEGARLAESRSSIDTNITVVAPATAPKNTLVDENGILIPDATPNEVAVAAARDVQDNSVMQLTAEAEALIAGFDTPEQAANAISTPPQPVEQSPVVVVNGPPTTNEPTRRRVRKAKDAAQTRVNTARESLSPTDAAIVERLVDSSIISKENLTRILDSITTNSKAPELSKQYLAALMNLKAVELAEEKLKITTLSEEEQLKFSEVSERIDTAIDQGKFKVEQRSALEAIMAGTRMPDEVIESGIFPASATLKDNLEILSKGHRAQREAAAVVTYQESKLYISDAANVKRYNEAKASSKPTDQQKATITLYEKHLERVQLGPMKTVSDIEQVQKAADAAKEKQALKEQAFTQLSDAELNKQAAMVVVAYGKEHGYIAQDVSDSAAASLLTDLLTTKFDRNTTEYKIAVLLANTIREGKPIEPELKLVGMMNETNLNKRFEKAKSELQNSYGSSKKVDLMTAYAMQRMQKASIVLEPLAVELLASRFNNAKLELNVDLNATAQIFQHPTIKVLMNRKEFDFLKFSNIIFRKIGDDETINKLLRIETELAIKSGDLTSEWARMSTDDYRGLLRAAVRDGDDLPESFRGLLRGILKNLERKERLGSGPNRFEANQINIDAENATTGRRFDIADEGLVASNREAILTNSYLEHQKILSGFVFDELQRRGRTDLADFFTERQTVVMEEEGVAQVRGTAIEKVNEVRVRNNKPAYDQKQFKNLQSEFQKIVDEVVNMVGITHTNFAIELTRTRLLTARTAKEKQGAISQQVKNFSVDHKDSKGNTVVTETADQVTVYQQKLDNISMEELADFEATVHRLFPEEGEEYSVDLAPIEIIYNKLDKNIIKDVLDGTINNGYQLLLALETKMGKGTVQSAIIEDLKKIGKDELEQVAVFATGSGKALGTYYDLVNMVELDIVNILRQGKTEGKPLTIFRETALHELLHAVTVRKIDRIIGELGISADTKGFDEARLVVERLAARGNNLSAMEKTVKELCQVYLETVELERAAYLDEFRGGELSDAQLTERFYDILSDGNAAADNKLYHVYNVMEFITNPLTNNKYMHSMISEAFESMSTRVTNPRTKTKTMKLMVDFERGLGINTQDSLKSSGLYKIAQSTMRILTQKVDPADSVGMPIGTTREFYQDAMPFRYVPDQKTILTTDMIPDEFGEVAAFLGDMEASAEHSKARSDLKAAKGRMLDTLQVYQQRRAELDLRAKIETEGMAGKDVSALEQRLDDLIVSADERQRILRGMGLHEELEPRDLEAMTNIVNGNSAFYTADVKQTLEYMRRLEASRAVAKIEKPMAYRDMNNEERTLFLIETMMPAVERAIGTRNQTAGVFSLFTDSVVGKKANQFIGGAVDYSKTADSDSMFLQFISKFFDPMMDLRDGELNLAFNMPSIDKLNSIIEGMYQKSGLIEAYDKVKAVAPDQETLNYINDTAWDYLARRDELPEGTRFKNEILAVIDSVNNLNKELHESLVKYGGLRSSSSSAEEYGTVRRAGKMAYQNPKKFAEALYKHMLNRSKLAHEKGEVSAVASEALGWINYTRSDSSDEIISISLTENSPLAKLFPDKEVDQKIAWSEARKVLKNGVEKLTKEESDKLFKALESSEDYKSSYKSVHAGRDSSYSVIRQAAEIARNRYMNFGDVGDTKSVKPRSESVGGGRDYAEERIITHDDLARDRELAQFFDKNIMRLTNDLLRGQGTEALSTKMMTDFFGGNVRITVLDMIEIFRNAGEGVRRGDVDPQVMAQVNKGYDRVKAVWEEFLGMSRGDADSMDPYYRDALLNSRYTVLLAGGVRAALSSVPELSRAIVASDHNKSKLRQIFPNLMLAMRYGFGGNREKLNQMASAYHWIRNMSAETLLARTEALPDNPFHGVAFGGRRGWFSTWTNQWNAIRGVNEVETSKFRKLLNYAGFPASIAGAPLAWINMVTTAIHVHNAQMNLTRNAKNFKKLVELMDGRTIKNMAEFERLADSAGLSSKEALDLSTAGILNPKIVDILVDMAADPKTKSDEMLDISKMYRWAREQTKYNVDDVDNAIAALGQYVGMTTRHTNTEPTLLDKRVNNSVYSKALSIFMQFLLSHSIQEIGRRRRYSTINYGKHIVGLMTMEAGVYALGRMYRGEEPYEDNNVEAFVRIATGMPMLGSYQYLAALLRQSAFAAYNTWSDTNTFEEQIRVPGLIDAPADTAPKRAMKGVGWGMTVLQDILKEGF
jgi:hypothetical protein